MNYSFKQFLNSKDFYFCEVFVKNQENKRRTTDLSPFSKEIEKFTKTILGDQTVNKLFFNPIKSIDDNIIGFAKLYKLAVGPTKTACVSTFKNMKIYLTTDNKDEKQEALKNFLKDADELARLVIINPIFTIAPTELAFQAFAETLGVKPTIIHKLIFAFMTKIPYYIFMYVLPMLEMLSEVDNLTVQQTAKRISSKIKQSMPKTALYKSAA
jgi:hypothetical protein